MMLQDLFCTVKKSLYGSIVIATLLLVPYPSVFGATETFTVPAIVGSDTTPPSIPGNLSATPVATTQIDLVWDASSDNFLLSGYHIWRDDVRIATTTLTTYSDTGLTSSTTYAYYVTAYDSVFNESASSSVVATTTLSPAPPAPTSTASTTSGVTYGSRAHPIDEEIVQVRIYSEQDAVVIQYTTVSHIRSSVGWGISTSYERGSLMEETFSRTHKNRIEGLLPGTTYYFELEGENSIGRKGVMHRGTFTTLPPLDVFPPENVSGLVARIEEDDVILTWRNPQDVDFEKVRIVRSNLFYPSDIADGWVVYEGDGTEVRDREVLLRGERQYYTVFAYDARGNISSGAVTHVYRGRNVVPSTSTPPDEGVVVVDPTKNIIALTWGDVAFIQEGVRIMAREGVVPIDGSKQLRIELPYDRVPEHLKTILVSIGESASSTKVFTFLLRINNEKTAYTSTIAPFGVSSRFPTQLSVFDYTTSQIGYVSGVIESHIQTVSIEKDPDGIVARIFRIFSSDGLDYGGVIATVSMLLALVILAFLGRRIMHH